MLVGIQRRTSAEKLTICQGVGLTLVGIQRRTGAKKLTIYQVKPSGLR